MRSFASILFVAIAVAACGPATESNIAEPETNAMPPPPPVIGAEYVFEDLKVAKFFAAEPTRSEDIYWDYPYTENEPEVAGENPSHVISLEDDSIVYTMTVVPMPDKVDLGPSIMGECIYLMEESGIEVASKTLRLGDGPREIFGLEIVIDLRDGGGRIHTSCFFENGNFYKIDAHVSPAHGEPDSEAADQFIRTIRFLD